MKKILTLFYFLKIIKILKFILMSHLLSYLLEKSDCIEFLFLNIYTFCNIENSVCLNSNIMSTLLSTHYVLFCSRKAFILKVCTKNMPMGPDVSLEKVAAETCFFSELILETSARSKLMNFSEENLHISAFIQTYSLGSIYQ